MSGGELMGWTTREPDGYVAHSGIALTYKFGGTDAAATKFGQLQRALADATPIMGAIGLGLVRNTQDRFESQTDPTGAPWKALNPLYAAHEKHGAGILRESGQLFKSITYRATRDSVEVGTNKIYARVHQEGAFIVPRRAKALRFMLGGHLVQSGGVTIPARPYLGINDADQELIMDVLETALGQVITG